MKSSILILLVFVVVATVNARATFEKNQKFPTTTSSISSEEMFRLYEKAKKEVDEMNKKYPGATFEINRFSFMSENERKKVFSLYFAKKPSPSKSSQLVSFDDDDNITAPESYDWRKFGKITSVKDQTNDCGACYAFASTAGVESQYLIQNNQSLDLSEEYVLECDALDDECGGGLEDHALDVFKTNGVPSEACIPYHATEGKCPDVPASCERYNIKGYKTLEKDETKFPGMLYKYGPIVIGLNSGAPELSYYQSGVLDYPNDKCGTGGHSVLIVGYTKDYWIAKNSWGETWDNENGYFRFKRGINFCTFATQDAQIPFLSDP